MSADAIEVNFDGIIGLSHNYGGLSHGNLASSANKDTISYPKRAALEGLEKAWSLSQLGLVQGMLPPQMRPFLPSLRNIGFGGTDIEILETAWHNDKRLIANISAASSMWAANAGTISPSADCKDGRLHVTIANLITMPHRAIEAQTTLKIMQRLLGNNKYFCVHKALPAHSLFGDEGAANHMRMCADHGGQALEIFVFGRDGFEKYDAEFPARQTLQTGEAIMRKHGLKQNLTLHLQQGKKAIAAGAFHNDVVAIANRNVLFYHEFAFEDKSAIDAIKIAANGIFEPIFIEVSNDEVPINDAIKSYLFNTQLLDIPNETGMTLIAPMECFENARVKTYLEQLIKGNCPITNVQYVDVRQSMNNGGGPACLRLRMVLTPTELAALGGRFILDAALYNDLKKWINRHYRETLIQNDLINIALLEECQSALNELCHIMDLGKGFYDFNN